MTAENSTEHVLTAGDYIGHHLTHLQNKTMSGIVDFSVYNMDSVFWSILIGVVGSFVLWRAARASSSGVPGRFQAAVEILVELVDSQAKGIVHNAQSRKLVSPLALSVFVWIFLMNAMDWAWYYEATGQEVHHAYMRVVPTADLSTALGLSSAVLLVCLFYNLKIKGLGGWLHELFTAPFGNHPILWPINFLMQMIEFAAKTVSHGMRLFGNMYAGELFFMLIALMGSYAAMSLSGILLPIGHIIAGSIWAIFHILIVTLQAFIFMMLTLVYVGQAHDAH